MNILFEDWSYVRKFEGIYIISNRGRIFSMTRTVCVLNVFKRNIMGQHIKLKKNKNGYMQVCLHRSGSDCYIYVHVLVATTFLYEQNKKTCVNHIDGIRNNNSVYNLEWSTISENHLHAYEKLGRINPSSKPIFMINSVGDIVGEFNDCSHAGRCLNKHPSTISDLLRGKTRLSREGYSFKLKSFK